jgi:hypothetical protein
MKEKNCPFRNNFPCIDQCMFYIEGQCGILLAIKKYLQKE